MNRFKDKVVLITGAAGDIGRAACTLFAGEGASLFLVDRDEAGLDLLRSRLEGEGVCCETAVTDVTDEAQVKICIERAEKRFGAIHVLFNNAGIEGPVAAIDDYSPEDFDRIMAINVRSVFLCMHYVMPIMRSTGGAIINTASVAGITGAAGVCGYNASKHAVIGLTRSVAKQEGAHGVRVNAVCPAPVSGRMMSSLEAKFGPDDTEAVRAEMQARIPMGRYGTPEDVVNLVAYLASDDAAFLNGGVYTVDGGLTA